MTTRILVLAAVLCLLAVAGCRQQMADQPRFNPLAESDFFGDGRSARAPEPGTAPRGESADEFNALDEGKSQEARWAASVAGMGVGSGFNVLAVYKSAFAFPIPVDYDLLRHGRERFNIYCSVCHDRVGTGRGKIVERGYLHPPSYHIERLANAPLSHFYEVISDGYGAMPSYSDKLTPSDRWAIIAYIRALQLSQDAPYAELTPTEQEKIDKEQK